MIFIYCYRCAAVNDWDIIPENSVAHCMVCDQRVPCIDGKVEKIFGPYDSRKNFDQTTPIRDGEAVVMTRTMDRAIINGRFHRPGYRTFVLPAHKGAWQGEMSVWEEAWGSDYEAQIGHANTVVHFEDLREAAWLELFDQRGGHPLQKGVVQ